MPFAAAIPSCRQKTHIMEADSHVNCERDAIILEKATYRAKSETVLTLALFVTLIIAAAIVYVITAPFRLILKLSQPPPPPKSSTVTIPLKVHEPEEGTNENNFRDTVLLIHGFPDCSALWDTTVAKLVTCGYRCLVVDLPASSGKLSCQNLSFEKVTQAIHDAVLAAGFRKVTVIGHDWGALYTHLLATNHPDMVSRLAFLDVAPTATMAPLDAVCMLAYQIYFVICFYIGEPLGSWGVRLAAVMFGYNARPMTDITTDMLWPYPIMLSTYFKNGPLVKNESTTTSSTDTTRVPTFFAYGAKKQFYFHDLAFIKYARSSPCGRVESFESDHWFFQHLPQQWVISLVSWLEESHNHESLTSN